MSGYRHSVSVAAVVVREDGRVLAIRRADNGQVQIPGGILEEAETIEAGLAREVREETGLEVRIEAPTGIYKHLKLGVVALVFRCALVSGEEALSEETTEVLWLTPDEATQEMAEVFAIRVHDALADGQAARVRAHDGVRLVETEG